MEALTPVTSSNVEAVGWEADTLRVRYKNGGVYDYRGVPERIFQELLAAESAGKFINSRVKNVYSFTKVS